jgi:PhnB protein
MEKALMAKKSKKAKAEKKAKKAKKVRAVPKGYNSVTTNLNLADASAFIEFAKAAFGGKLRASMAGPDGKLVHAEIEIGDSVVMCSDSMREPPRPGGLFLYIKDVDKVLDKAVKAGAKVLMPPQDMFWGDRFARIEDPQGNYWGIATHVEDVSPKEMKKRSAAFAAQQAASAE